LVSTTKEKGYLSNLTKNSTIALSGGFDIIHAGHIRMFKGARLFGKVIIILNSDDWLKKRKGYVLMPFEQRKEILLSLRDIHNVVEVDDSDGTVCEALLRIKPTIFGNGGFRTTENTPERRLCQEHGIVTVYGIGGGERDQITLHLEEKIKSIGKKLANG